MMTILLLSLLVAAALCGLYRLLCGPNILDRLLALDLMIVCALGMATFIEGTRRTAAVIDWIIALTLLGFLAGVAIAFYLLGTPPSDSSSS